MNADSVTNVIAKITHYLVEHLTKINQTGDNMLRDLQHATLMIKYSHRMLVTLMARLLFVAKTRNLPRSKDHVVSVRAVVATTNLKAVACKEGKTGTAGLLCTENNAQILNLSFQAQITSKRDSHFVAKDPFAHSALLVVDFGQRQMEESIWKTIVSSRVGVIIVKVHFRFGLRMMNQ